MSDPIFDIGRDLQRAYDEGYKQGRRDEAVGTEMSLPNGEQTHTLRTETHACDCISRQAARNALLNKGQHSKRYKLGETWELNLMEIEETLGELPSVTPERPHGYWIWNKRTGDYECSECGCNPIYERTTPDCSEIDKYKFCRWCGAKMEVQNGKENS